jgi:hypothetical protein
MMTSALLISWLWIGPTEAARFKKMTDDQVVKVLREDPKSDNRVDAADELALRKSSLGVAYLGAVCERDPKVEVCAAAVTALATIRSEASQIELQEILESEGLDQEQRRRALTILAEQDAKRLDNSLPRLVARYRFQPEGLGADIFRQVQERDLRELVDAAMFAASDPDAHRGTRLAAMSTTEKFGHNRLHDAWLLNLRRDPDRNVRKHCAESLGRPGLPGSRVVPALTTAVERDKEGAVRAAALKSLLQYANKGLLPMLHKVIREERHPYSFEAALTLLLPLANSSSIKPLAKRLEDSERMKHDDLSKIVSLFVRLQDPAVMSPLLALEQRHQGTPIAEEVREALALYDEEDELAKAAAAWRPGVQFQPWVPGSQDPVFSDLTVSLGPGGVLDGVPGSQER